MQNKYIFTGDLSLKCDVSNYRFRVLVERTLGCSDEAQNASDLLKVSLSLSVEQKKVQKEKYLDETTTKCHARERYYTLTNIQQCGEACWGKNVAFASGAGAWLRGIWRRTIQNNVLLLRWCQSSLGGCMGGMCGIVSHYCAAGTESKLMKTARLLPLCCLMHCRELKLNRL